MIRVLLRLGVTRALLLVWMLSALLWVATGAYPPPLAVGLAIPATWLLVALTDGWAK